MECTFSRIFRGPCSDTGPGRMTVGRNGRERRKPNPSLRTWWVYFFLRPSALTDLGGARFHQNEHFPFTPNYLFIL